MSNFNVLMPIKFSEIGSWKERKCERMHKRTPEEKRESLKASKYAKIIKDKQAFLKDNPSYDPEAIAEQKRKEFEMIPKVVIPSEVETRYCEGCGMMIYDAGKPLCFECANNVNKPLL